MGAESVEPRFPYLVLTRWSDFDRYGHANNAVFVTYLEIVREQFLVSSLGAIPAFVLVRLELEFRREVAGETTQLRGAVAVVRLGTSSLVTRESLALPDGSIAAEAIVTSVLWDPDRRRPRPISPGERAGFSSFLEVQG